MDTHRRTAISVGVLFIIGTAAGILSVVFTGSTLTDPDYLIKVAANENQIILAALCVLIMGLALALVPVLLYPLLKQQNEVLALGYVVFRGALEAVSDIAMVITWLFLVQLSRAYVAAGAPAVSAYQTVGALLQGGNDALNPIVVIVFSLGALMLYTLFYTSQLIPRWISIWGYIAIGLHLTTGLLVMFHLMSPFSTIDVIMNLPILLQEMVMAVWLIVKGFTPAASVSGRAQPAPIRATARP